MIGLLARHRAFRLLWTGETSSQVGNSLTTVVMPLVAVGTLHASALLVSALRAATWLPWLLVGLPAGALIERAGQPRRLMIGCDLASCATFLTVPAAVAIGDLTAVQLVAVALAGGAIAVFFETAYRVCLLGIVRDESDRATANGALQGSASAANIAGPGLAGLLVELVGSSRALIADALSFLASAACLLAIRLPRAAADAERRAGSLRDDVREGLRYVGREPLLRSLTLFGATANLALTGYQSLLVVFLIRTTGLRPGTVGLLLALVGAGGVSGALLARPLTRALGSGRALLATKTLGGASALLIPLATTPSRAAFVVAGGVLVGAGIVAGNIITTTFLQSYVPPRLFARTAACNGVVNYGTMPVGALLAGVLATALGVPAAMWIMCAIVPLASLFLLCGPLRTARELPGRPDPGVA